LNPLSDWTTLTAMALGTDYELQDCALARALEVVGERWSLLIVRDALLGKTRFSEFQRSLGIARNVLADRLDSLVREGVMERRGTGHPEYVLTGKGRRLEPTIFQLMKWGDDFYVAAGGPPRVAIHKECGGIVDHELECGRCGARVRYRDFEIQSSGTPALVSARASRSRTSGVRPATRR
jgi:DNA-binding HxlR family transcriptional regulator